LRDSSLLVHLTSTDNITDGGKIGWKITSKLKTMSLWMLIKNGPVIPKRIKEDGTSVIKKPGEFDGEDYKMMEKNAKAKKLLYFGLGPDEYTRISECESAKDIWDALQIAHEGTT